MKKAAVLGFPISHSLSPRLHGYWLQKYDIPGRYEALETKPENLAERITELSQQGYSGVNLTVPLKQDILPLLDEVTELAESIGAVNTVTFQNGKIYGDNTDAYGFIENLKQGAGNLSPYLKHAVVLGAGGAARAVIAGLLEEGGEKITLLNRTRARAEEVAEMHSRIAVAEWSDREQQLETATLLVNTTSLGMRGQPDLELSLQHLPVNALVTDIVYNPLTTTLLQNAGKRGNPVVGGLGMLIHQAVPAFEAFFGKKPSIDNQLKEKLENSIYEHTGKSESEN